eukprot:Lankesteria_metandrocarpae@DN1007_c0_g1_i1.p1
MKSVLLSTTFVVALICALLGLITDIEVATCVQKRHNKKGHKGKRRHHKKNHHKGKHNKKRKKKNPGYPNIVQQYDGDESSATSIVVRGGVNPTKDQFFQQLQQQPQGLAPQNIQQMQQLQQMQQQLGSPVPESMMSAGMMSAGMMSAGMMSAGMM